jgi:hypothetical protein
MKDKGDWKRDRHSGRGEGEDNSPIGRVRSCFSGGGRSAGVIGGESGRRWVKGKCCAECNIRKKEKEQKVTCGSF